MLLGRSWGVYVWGGGRVFDFPMTVRTVSESTLGTQRFHQRLPHHSRCVRCSRTAGAPSFRRTGVPACTMFASSEASQFVSRMHPCDCFFPTSEGVGAP